MQHLSSLLQSRWFGLKGPPASNACQPSPPANAIPPTGHAATAHDGTVGRAERAGQLRGVDAIDAGWDDRPAINRRDDPLLKPSGLREAGPDTGFGRCCAALFGRRRTSHTARHYEQRTGSWEDITPWTSEGLTKRSSRRSGVGAMRGDSRARSPTNRADRVHIVTDRRPGRHGKSSLHRAPTVAYDVARRRAEVSDRPLAPCDTPALETQGTPAPPAREAPGRPPDVGSARRTLHDDPSGNGGIDNVRLSRSGSGHQSAETLARPVERLASSKRRQGSKQHSPSPSISLLLGTSSDSESRRTASCWLPVTMRKSSRCLRARVDAESPARATSQRRRPAPRRPPFATWRVHEPHG
jgi:hypothetical protein